MNHESLGWWLLAPSLLAAAAPMITFATLIWWLDRFDRDPPLLVAWAFLWGAIGGILGAILGSLTLLAPWRIAGVSVGAASTVVVAPLAEEPAKAMILVAMHRSRHFDGAADGFVYGAAAGFGFAMTENALYFLTVAAKGDPVLWLQTVLVRTLYSGVMHATATAVVGAALGFAHLRPAMTRTAAGCIGLTAAMGIHALWNGLIAIREAQGDTSLAQFVNLCLLPAEALAVLLAFLASVAHERQTIARALQTEARLGHLPPHHVRWLTGWNWQRRGPNVERYRRTVLKLGLRRHQSQSTSDPFYRRDVRRLRRAVRAMLAPEEPHPPLASPRDPG